MLRKNQLTLWLCLLFLKGPNLIAQTNLNWASSFSPAWANGNTNGTASNIGGNSINCTATLTMVGGGSYVQALGSSGAQTPTVSGATFTVPGTGNRLQVTPNFSNNAGYVNIVLSFTTMVSNVSFKIVDIDKSDAFSTTYFDEVIVTGSNGSNNYNPTITKYDATTNPNFLVISGNTAHVNTTGGQGGNTASDASDQLGTVNVNFNTAVINSITIRYGNATGANINPASQAIAIGSVSFTQSTLPVSLINFSGHKQGQDVLLDWTTSQEFNSAAFSIERSEGANGWQKIGTVAAAGTSTSEKNYSFTDMNPPGSILLYRLQQTDIDGNFKYSGIVRIVNKGAIAVMQAYPNPFISQFNISIHADRLQLVSTVIVDCAGRILKSVSRNLYPGDNNFMVGGIGPLGKGIYLVELRDEGGNIIGRAKLLKE